LTKKLFLPEKHFKEFYKENSPFQKHSSSFIAQCFMKFECLEPMEKSNKDEWCLVPQSFYRIDDLNPFQKE
jgi:hypothetical protein